MWCQEDAKGLEPTSHSLGSSSVPLPLAHTLQNHHRLCWGKSRAMLSTHGAVLPCLALQH